VESLPVIVIGAGGHAKVLIENLLSLAVRVIGMTDPDPGAIDRRIYNIPVIGAEDIISDYPPDEICLVLGFGSVGSTKAREKTYLQYKDQGYNFLSVIHPSAVVANDVHLSEGVQLMAGVIIQPGCCIGCNTIINTGVSIDHDCRIGDHVHLAPGVTLSGSVAVGKGTHVGTGATIIQKITIGRNCLVGAGALVIGDVPENVTVMGHPAKIIEKL
jgi:sugar O-acyltransferase (sialic acid O-acetyltransferase NeuD family)